MPEIIDINVRCGMRVPTTNENNGYDNGLFMAFIIVQLNPVAALCVIASENQGLDVSAPST